MFFWQITIRYFDFAIHPLSVSKVNKSLRPTFANMVLIILSQSLPHSDLAGFALAAVTSQILTMKVEWGIPQFLVTCPLNGR